MSSQGLIETFEIRNYTVYKLKQYQFSIQLYTVASHLERREQITSSIIDFWLVSVQSSIEFILKL